MHVNRNMHTAGLTAEYNISKSEMSVQTYKKTIQFATPSVAVNIITYYNNLSIRHPSNTNYTNQRCRSFLTAARDTTTQHVYSTTNAALSAVPCRNRFRRNPAQNCLTTSCSARFLFTAYWIQAADPQLSAGSDLKASNTLSPGLQQYEAK